MMFVATVGQTFMAMTETWSDTTWNEMGWFLKSRLIVQCLLAGVPVIIAFLNKTVSRLEAGKESDTQRWERKQIEKQKE